MAKSISKEVSKLIVDLGWDYDRMSQSGKSIYDKLLDLVDKYGTY